MRRQCLWPQHGRTLLFHLRCKRRVVAVTVGQAAESVARDPRAPLLPPSFNVWVTISTRAEPQPIAVHWGAVYEPEQHWRVPPDVELPPGSLCQNGHAVRSPLSPAGARVSVTLRLGPPALCPHTLEFVLVQHPNEWIKTNEGGNFVIRLRSVIAELQLNSIRESTLAGQTCRQDLNCPAAPEIHHVFALPSHEAELDVALWCSDEGVAVDIMTNLRDPAVLHWGFLSTDAELWSPPDPRLRPPDCLEAPPGATYVESPFHFGLLGPATSLIQSVQLVFPYDVIFEHCVTAEKLRAASWVLPVLTDGRLSSFPERLVFVLRTREAWVHNECASTTDEWKVQLCPLTLPSPPTAETATATELIRHSAATVAGDFQIAIPFSEGFKARLFEALHRATEEREIMDKLHCPLLVNPKFSVPVADSVKPTTAPKPPAQPLGFLAPPGTVLFFNTIPLDDPGGTAHLLAVEEPGRVKVHIIASLAEPCVVHWAWLTDSGGWLRPDPDLWPAGSEAADEAAVDSPMRVDPRSRMCRLEIRLPLDRVRCAGLVFVLRSPDRWIKAKTGNDLVVKFRREKIPNHLLSRQWKGPHSHLVVRLLQNELTVDSVGQRYVTLTNLVESVSYDRVDVIEFWAWLFVWWRFSHLGYFDWQRHTHSRPWECAHLSLQVSEAIVGQWKSTTRSRPIIRLLLQHINCLRPDRDLREELNETLTKSGLILLPFFEQWYRKCHNCLGVEDWVICKGVIAMLETLSVPAFFATLKFYGYDFDNDIPIQAHPIIPPSFNFLQSQLTHLAQLKLRDRKCGSVNDGRSSVESLSILNPRHPSTSFIAGHIETQSMKLRVLIDKFRSFGDGVSSLFFGVDLDVAEASAAESPLSSELTNILKEIRAARNKLRPPCPRIVNVEQTVVHPQTLEEMIDEANEYYRIFELASKGRVSTLPVISHCTDHRVIRDFVFLDIALDNVQQMALSRVFGFTGPPLSLFAQKTLPRTSKTHCCEDLTHPSWNSPQTLLVPRLKYDSESKRWIPTVKCLRFQCGITVKLVHIIANLLMGIKMLHPSIEEANSLLNDWRVVISQNLATSFTSFADYNASFEQQAIVEALQNPTARDDFMNFVASFLSRVERCTSRIIDLCLVYFSDKVKFIHSCLSDLDLLKPPSWRGDRLEASSFAPCPPRPFRGEDPLMSIHQEKDFSSLKSQSTIDTSSFGPVELSLGRSEQSLMDVHAFVLGIVKHSVLFWIVLALTRITPTLRSFTHLQNWRLLSPVRYAVGTIVCVDSFEDLKKNEAYLSKPVLLVVKRAVGHERIPFNTAAIIMGPTVVPLQGEDSVLCAPHLLSPLSLQARQMSLMAAVPLDPAIFDKFCGSLRALGAGDLVELFVTEDLAQIEVRRIEPGGDEMVEPGADDLIEPDGLRTPEADAALGAEVWKRLKEPVSVCPSLPPQSGPLLPSLRHFCSHPLPLEPALLPLEESRSSTRTHESDDRGSWGLWRRNNAFLRSIPVITPGLFNRLYGANSNWLLAPEEFTPLLVGSRAMAIRRLREIIRSEEEVRATTAPTLAVPFGAFETTLRDPENHALSEKLYALLCDLHRLSLFLKQHHVPPWRLTKEESSASLGSIGASSRSGSEFLTELDSGRKVERLLRECRSVVRSLKPTRDFTQALTALVEGTDTNWDRQCIGKCLLQAPDRLWSTIKNVWCSQFTPAVWHTTQILSAPFDSPRFSVLIQHIPVSSYAFKVELHEGASGFCHHDKHQMLAPSPDRRLFGELSAGLPLAAGELFSGGHVMLGRPLAFVRREKELQVLCFSSQPHTVRLRRPSLLLRPDGNVRGLGRIMPSGGLVCASTEPTSRQRFEFHREPLFVDAAWRTYLLSRVADAAQALQGNSDLLAVEGIIAPLTEIPPCRAILLAGSSSTATAKSFSLIFTGAQST